VQRKWLSYSNKSIYGFRVPPNADFQQVRNDKKENTRETGKTSCVGWALAHADYERIMKSKLSAWAGDLPILQG